MVIIYGKPNCIYCERAKNLLSGLMIQYEYKDISDPNIRDELLDLVPAAKTVPQIWVGDSYIGGYIELVDYISNRPTSWDGDYGQEVF